MNEGKIIWKAIDTNGNKVIGKGTSEFNKQLLNNLLNIYQNPYHTVVLELFDIGCTERIGILSDQSFNCK
jgi:hypothetical protein